APAWDDGPGTQAWNNDDVKCSSDADCDSTEACLNGVCQMRVCSEPSYKSTAPLGKIHYFGLDREIAIIGDGEYVDTYEPKDATYKGSFDYSKVGKLIVDIAGGDFLGTRPQQFAYAHANSDLVTLEGGGTHAIHVGINPIAIAAGDTDGDG